MGKLIIIMGATASGKDTLANELYRHGVKRFMSYTTRPMRQGESDGKGYHFVTKEEFDEDILNDKIIEHREYSVANGETWYYYFKKDVLTLDDDQDYCCIADLNGTTELVKYFGKLKTLVIYLNTPVDICMKRALNREVMSTIKVKEICRRMISDIEDIVHANSTIEVADMTVNLADYDVLYDTLYDLGLIRGIQN